MYITAENFCSCFFLTKMTHNGCLIGEIVYDVKWYELPIGDQRAIRRIVERSQKPFLFKGFGIIYYSLETFLKVIPKKKQIFNRCKYLVLLNYFVSFYVSLYAVRFHILCCFVAWNKSYVSWAVSTEQRAISNKHACKDSPECFLVKI